MMWEYAPTKINPAGLVGRGTTVYVLTSNDQWLNAPSFLQKQMNEWPQMNLEPVAEEKIEFKKNRLQWNPFATLSTTITANEWVFDPKKYSSG